MDRSTPPYGLIPTAHMPAGDCSHDQLPCSGLRWAVTSDFRDAAKNHCGAVAVTNLALYLAPGPADGREIFPAVHRFVGNGPVAALAPGASAYFSSLGRTLRRRPVRSFSGFQDAIARRHPCALLLAAAPLRWHWVLAVGWREYGPKARYLQIMDGWNRSADRFYRPWSGSAPAAAAEYWLA